MFKNKIILITGGTGSFGSAFLNYIITNKLQFKEILILSRDEKKQHDMRALYNNPNIKFHIGDVRDKECTDLITKNVDYIFHAAALKQVPSCEFYPMEAIKTNVMGTNNILTSSINNGVKKVVCLSTDKAVYPINAMGISKALMEKIAISKSLIGQNKTIICVTRYGNVLGSRGSVIPVIIDQIQKGKPITITDPEMTRFIMPMKSALDLVLYALKFGKNGNIFVPKTPATKIRILVSAILKFMNKKKYPIKIIGKRHGEKDNESIMTDEELIKAKSLKGYYKIPSDIRNLNYDLYFNEGTTKIQRGSYSSDKTKLLNEKDLVVILNQIKNDLKNA